MNDSTNTFFGWVLFAGVIALGLSAISSRVFDLQSPETPGYIIEAAEAGEVDAGPSLAELLAGGSAESGQTVFAKCMACHSIENGGANNIGPNLYGIMGLEIGNHAPGFAYSSALSSKGGDWTWENMDAWLKSPRAFANGTTMSFAGLGDGQDRADLMLYLNANGSDLPLPEVVVEEAAEDGEMAEGEAPEGEEAAGEDTAVEEEAAAA